MTLALLSSRVQAAAARPAERFLLLLQSAANRLARNRTRNFVEFRCANVFNNENVNYGANRTVIIV